MLSEEDVADLSAVRSHTEDKIKEAVTKDAPVLIEAPPVSGKTTISVQEIPGPGRQVTYLAGRHDLYDEAIDKAERNKIDWQQIRSPHETCPTFQGEYGSDLADAAKRLYAKGVSGWEIHFSASENAATPCGNECPYISHVKRIEGEIDDIDLLIGHHTHINRQKYVEDRLVFVDEFNPDPFLTRFPSREDSAVIDDPGSIIGHFLDVLADSDTSFPTDQCKDITDLLESRDNESIREKVFDWFEEYGARRIDAQSYDFYEISTYRYNQAHMYAPLLTLSLFCMERLGRGMEAAPVDEDQTVEAWEAAGLTSGHRVVRDRNTGVMHLLHPPPFLDSAKQIIGLDGTPTLEMWNLVFGHDRDFQHEQIVDPAHLTSYLKNALNMRCIRMGDGMYHYAGGEISPKDEQRLEFVRRYEGEPFPLISTKSALQIYNRRGWLENNVREGPGLEENVEGVGSEYFVRNYAQVLSSNVFEKESLGVVSGSPFPGDEVIQVWAGFSGEFAEGDGSGVSKSFGEYGDLFYKHFAHNQVLQAILRFGRDESVYSVNGSTVYVNTKCIPDWFDPIEIRRNEKEGYAILAYFVAPKREDTSEEKYLKVSEIKQLIQDEGWVEYISEGSIRNVREDLLDAEILEEEPYPKNGVGHRWVENNKLWVGDDGLAAVSTPEALYVIDIYDQEIELDNS